jgi:vancomycin resistance protein YoaR
MKLKNQEVKRVKFYVSAQKNDPVRLIRKRIEYLSATDKNKPGVTQQFEKDISAAIREVRKLAAKRHGLDASRLAAEADELAEQLRLAMKGARLRDHASPPDPCTYS